MNGQRHLRLVERPPRQRLLAVRISVLDGRAAFGRSRAFRLSETAIEELVDVALQLEARR